jgi:hypothetical protein
MSRRSLLASVGLVGLLLMTVVGALFALLRWEPTFYRQAAVPPGVPRLKLSKAAMANMSNTADNFLFSRLPAWDATLTAEEMNAFFEEEFVRAGWRDRMMPEGWSDPRVAVCGGRIRLAARYSRGPISTVVSLDVRVWLVAKEANVIALELVRFRAGALPLAPSALLETIREAAHPYNVEVTWYRHGRNPVALLRLMADQPRPTMLLSRLELAEGRVMIGGRSLESSAKFAPAPLTPP